MQASKSTDFCDRCKSESEAISAGDVVSLNFIGRSFVGGSNRCLDCGSTERNLYFFIGAPLIPLGTWKVIDVAPDRIISRKLAQGSIADFDTHTTYTADQQRRWHKKLIIFFLVFVVVVNVLIRLFK